MGLYRMPSLGADMEKATLIEWFVKPGDRVKRGDVIAVVETEKGAIEIEIFEDGQIGALLVEPGTVLKVGGPMAEIAGAGETDKPVPEETDPAAQPVVTPEAKPWAPAGALPAREGIVASPAARRLAAERGIDLDTLEGSGPGGAIVSSDVPDTPASGGAKRSGLDFSEMRKVIAAAMSRAKQEIPHYYLQHTFDLHNAQTWLSAANARLDPPDRLLMGALFVKAVARALTKYPEFNGHYGPDGFVPSGAVHVGLAVAMRGGGLIAPALHDTDRLSLDALMKQMRDLVNRVRKGGLRGSELADPTITVSSLGDRGVDSLYGVIYPPQVAIVGFGAMVARPWAVGETIEARPVVTVTLSADHRVSDGHRGALFLAHIAKLLQDPEELSQ